MVARTRKIIENNSNKNFNFPKQEKPENKFLGIKKLGKYNSFDEIFKALLASNLTAYKPSNYMKGDNKLENQRESSLVKMMGILITKRLESSWHSCLKTIENVLNIHKKTLEKVNSNLDLNFQENDFQGEIDDEVNEIMTSLDKKHINLNEMQNIEGFKSDLEKDILSLQEFYDNLYDFSEKFNAGEIKDEKLEELKKIISNKQKKENKKLIVFTAYKDTAEYIYENLSKNQTLKNRMACVTGDTKNIEEVLIST